MPISASRVLSVIKPGHRAGELHMLGAGYGASASEPVTRIEVVASKTEQKQQQQQQAQPSSPARPPAPAWAGHPPPHSSLSVLKEGTVIQNLPLSRPATLFGRYVLQSSTFRAAFRYIGALLSAGLTVSWAWSTCPDQHVGLDRAECKSSVHCRVATADVICDHGSLSRQHAQLCYKPATRQWLVVDLGSTHGTFVDGHRLPKVPKEKLSFAALCACSRP